MAKFDTDVLFETMNNILPDSGPLAVVNMLYEVSNGKLANDDADGAAAGEAEDAKIAAFYAYIDLNGNSFHSARVFDYPGGTDEIFALMGGRIDALPEETEQEMEVAPEGVTNFPSTFAAMIAWRSPDRGVWYVTYHHPAIPYARACTILKHTRDVIDEQRTQGPSEDGSSN